MKKKIYIGCSLTHAPEEFKDSVNQLKERLRKDFEILDFVGLANGTPQDVFEWDTKCVRRCDLFVAICDYPAIGLGYEIGVALEIGKPILAVAHNDSKITRLVLGVNKKGFTFQRYQDLLDTNDLIHEKIEELQ